MARLLAVDWDQREARFVLATSSGQKVKVLAADDTEGAALQIQSDALDKEYYALKEKARALRKKSSE